MRDFERYQVRYIMLKKEIRNDHKNQGFDLQNETNEQEKILFFPATKVRRSIKPRFPG